MKSWPDFVQPTQAQRKSPGIGVEHETELIRARERSVVYIAPRPRSDVLYSIYTDSSNILTSGKRSDGVTIMSRPG